MANKNDAYSLAEFGGTFCTEMRELGYEVEIGGTGTDTAVSWCLQHGPEVEAHKANIRLDALAEHVEKYGLKNAVEYAENILADMEGYFPVGIGNVRELRARLSKNGHRVWLEKAPDMFGDGSFVWLMVLPYGADEDDDAFEFRLDNLCKNIDRDGIESVANAIGDYTEATEDDGPSDGDEAMEDAILMDMAFNIHLESRHYDFHVSVNAELSGLPLIEDVRGILDAFVDVYSKRYGEEFRASLETKKA